MELSDVLDDIQNTDAVKDNPPEVQFPESGVAPEQVNQDTEQTPVPDADKSIHADQLRALEHHKTCLIYRKAIDARPTLDKALATEIFTMLPDMYDPLVAAKLTSAASAHNKSLLSAHLDAYRPSPESMQPMIGQLYDALFEVMATVDKILPDTKSSIEAIQAQYARVQNTARIVFCRQQIDLMTTPLNELVKVDDRLIDFPPYAGVLVNKVFNILQSNLYHELYHEMNPAPTIAFLVEALGYRLNRLTEIQQELVEVERKLHLNYSDDNFTQTDFRVLVGKIEHVNATKRMFVTDTNFAEALLDFLTTLV